MVFRGCAPMYLSPLSKGQTFQEEGLIYSFLTSLKTPNEPLQKNQAIINVIDNGLRATEVTER